MASAIPVRTGKRAAVVVLGDIGRSPRMQYHSLSLASQAGMEVDIVANGGSDPHLLLRQNPSIHIHGMLLIIRYYFCCLLFRNYYIKPRKFSTQKSVNLS